MKGNEDMKEDLVLAVVSLIIAIVMGVFAVSNFYGGEIIAGVIKTGLVIWNCTYFFSHWQKYRKHKNNK